MDNDNDNNRKGAELSGQSFMDVWSTQRPPVVFVAAPCTLYHSCCKARDVDESGPFNDVQCS